MAKVVSSLLIIKLSVVGLAIKLNDAVFIDRIQLYRMGTGQMIIKDFELIGLCKVLDIPFEELENIIE